MSNIKEILESLGYRLTPDNNGWRSTRLYCQGDNPTALKIYKDGGWSDFVSGCSGKFEELIALTLGKKNIDEAKDWLKNKDYNFIQHENVISEPLIKEPKIFSEDILKDLKQDYSYWINRGISEKTLQENEGGLHNNRYWFIVRNDKNQIIGKTGRDITNKSKIKWIHQGQTGKWIYNFYLNNKFILDKKEVIILESIGDYLSLYECGIKNSLVLFGVGMNLEILNYLLRINPNKIILSLNNDSNKNFAGNIATVKLEKRLKKYFDWHQIKVIFSSQKDWNDVLLKDGKDSIIRQLT